MAQQSIIQNVENAYRFFHNSYYVNLIEFCPLYDNVDTYTLEGFMAKSLEPSGQYENIKISRKYVSDVWVEEFSLSPYFITEGYSPKGIVQGTFPQYSSEVLRVQTSDEESFRITSDTNYLYVTRKASGASYYSAFQSYDKNFFKDKAIPRKIILLIQAAGGGGGWADPVGHQGGNPDGDGGGSGAFLSLILDLDNIQGDGYGVQVDLGRCGPAGVGLDTNTDSNSSYLKLYQKSYPSTLNSLFYIGGGKGGKKNGNPGNGGAVQKLNYNVDNYYYYNVFSKAGGNGGYHRQFPNQSFNGEAMTATTLYTTSHSTYKTQGVNTKTFSSNRGGFSYGPYFGGGGAGSVYSPGGDQGRTYDGTPPYPGGPLPYSGNGQDGYGGAGGGGGNKAHSSGTPKNGGKGGGSILSIWY